MPVIDFSSTPIHLQADISFNLYSFLDFKDTPLLIAGSALFDVPVVAVASLEIPVPEISATEIGVEIVGDVILTIPEIMSIVVSGDILRAELLIPPTLISCQVLGEGIVRVSLKLPLYLSSSVLSGVVANASLEVPAPVIDGRSRMISKINVALILPAPSLLAFTKAIPFPLYHKGLVMNMSHFAVSDYNDFLFNSFAYFNGEYLGANSEGLFVLRGGEKNGRPILSRIRPGSQDFGLNIVKKPREVWLTCRSDGELYLILEIDEREQWEDLFEEIQREIGEQRVTIAKGLQGRFYTFEIQNRNGADFDLDALRVLGERIAKTR